MSRIEEASHTSLLDRTSDMALRAKRNGRNHLVSITLEPRVSKGEIEILVAGNTLNPNHLVQPPTKITRRY